MSNPSFKRYESRADDKRVINSNLRVEEAVERWRAANLKPEPEEEEVSSETVATTEDSEGFVEGIAKVVVKPRIDYEALAKAEADRILAEAHARAEKVITDAKNKAIEESFEVIEAAKSEAANQGYQEGLEMAAESIRQKEVELLEQLEEHKQALEMEFQEQKAALEEELVDSILSVFDQVFNIQFSDKKDILLYLIGHTIDQTNGGKLYRIRVNSQSEKFIRERMEYLVSKVSSDVTVELVGDDSLADNACYIETDSGVFECGVDVQLENLIKDIRSLSIH